MSYTANDYGLYFILDIPRSVTGEDAPRIVEKAVQHGATIIQLRGKDISTRELFRTAVCIRDICRNHHVPFIINDRVDIALASGADGVHVGKSDLPLEKVRELLPNGIIGCSIDDESDIRYAEQNGADYVSAGPVFATSTKEDTSPTLGLEGVRKLVSQSTLPCVAIGGITPQNARDVAATGVDGICTITGILRAPDIVQATRQMAAAVKERSS